MPISESMESVVVGIVRERLPEGIRESASVYFRRMPTMDAYEVQVTWPMPDGTGYNVVETVDERELSRVDDRSIVLARVISQLVRYIENANRENLEAVALRYGLTNRFASNSGLTALLPGPGQGYSVQQALGNQGFLGQQSSGLQNQSLQNYAYQGYYNQGAQLTQANPYVGVIAQELPVEATKPKEPRRQSAWERLGELEI